MKRTIALLSQLILTVVAASAQSGAAVDRAYDYNDEMEMFGGPAAGIFSVSTDLGKALGSTPEGGIFSIRYTHFFTRHAGAWASFSCEGASVPAANYFGAVNKADGECYHYSYTSYGNPYNLGFAPLFTAGGVYRLDWGSCAFRARAGLGYGKIVYNSFYYSRQDRSGTSESGPTYFGFLSIKDDSSGDYLTESSSSRLYYNTPAFVLCASAQFIYKLGRFYFLVDAGISGSPSRATCLVSTTGTKKYVPSNYVEAVANEAAIGKWYADESDVRTHTVKQGAGIILHAGFGIGLCLGQSTKGVPTKYQRHEK